MFVVKIVILMIVITIVWKYIATSLIKSNPEKEKKWKENHNYPFWYYGLGLMIFADCCGIIYIAAYFLFVHQWR